MKSRNSYGLAFILMIAPCVVQAAWYVDEEIEPTTGVPHLVALVKNTSGHSLRIYPGNAKQAKGQFQIQGGYDTLAPFACPTYQIPGSPPTLMTSEGGACRVGQKTAFFTADAKLLRNMAKGNVFSIRYSLASLGYRETMFSLKGSRQALLTVLGKNAMRSNRR